MAKETKIIGSIRIDSASCWIGDPAHVYDVQRMRLQDLQYGYEAKEDEAQFEDHENYQDYYGLGMSVKTGWGDGIYPVTAEIDEEGNIAAITVHFLPHPYYPGMDSKMEAFMEAQKRERESRN